MTFDSRPDRSRLVIRQTDPFNAETPLGPDVAALTSSEDHYVRSHFPVPAAPTAIAVEGAVKRPLWLTIEQVREFPRVSLVVTMECAGNGRVFLDPPICGVAWKLGAVSTSEWTGAPLDAVLQAAELDVATVEIVFSGADGGMVGESVPEISYERSLTVDHAMEGSVLLAYEMNGEPLSMHHGAPVRLIVPGWYGMASVKWLDRITAVREPFRGHFQTEDYVVRLADESYPCREMEPRAIIVTPEDASVVVSGAEISVTGYAWSGRGEITRVEVGFEGQEPLVEAELAPITSRHAWRVWSAEITMPSPGEHRLAARASDSAGNIQPLTHAWNPGGYNNNGVVPRVLHVLE